MINGPRMELRLPTRAGAGGLADPRPSDHRSDQSAISSNAWRGVMPKALLKLRPK